MEALSDRVRDLLCGLRTRWALLCRAGTICAICVICALAGAGCGSRGFYDLQPPGTVASMPRHWHTEGDRANDVIARLHPPSSVAGQSWIAAYGGDDRVVIYATRFRDALQAEAALGQMNTAISGGNTPFAIPKQVKIGGRTVWRTDSEGRNHVYFVKGNWVVWIQAPEKQFKPALDALVWNRGKRT